MGRRSASNPRYRKGAQLGTTRRSAASAKPKRAAGELSKRETRTPVRKQPAWAVVPDTPQFRIWRKIWFGLLIAAMVFSIGAYAFHKSNPPVATLSIAFAYSCLFSGIFIDLFKIRRMRKQWAADMMANATPAAADRSAAKPDTAGKDSEAPADEPQDEGKAD